MHFIKDKKPKVIKKIYVLCDELKHKDRGIIST